MKKNILKVSLVAVFALFAGYNVYSSQKLDVMSDLAMTNVEALASGEGGHWTGRIWLTGENQTGGCIHCPEDDSNCTC